MSLRKKPVETAAAVEIRKNHRISTAAWKTRRQQRAGFPTVPTGSTRITSPRVTYVSEHVLPMSPVLTLREGIPA